MNNRYLLVDIREIGTTFSDEPLLTYFSIHSLVVLSVSDCLKFQSSIWLDDLKKNVI